jgi:glycerol-3-phosphate cytidylyltransferase
MRVGFTCSSWDLLHSGHVQMLKDARDQCDYLIVGIQTDPTVDRPDKNKPIQSIVERYTQLKAIKYVDEIIPYTTEKDLEDIIAMYTIHVRILGEEYLNTDFTGKSICISRNIQLIFNQRRHCFSSSELRARIINAKENK